MRQHDTTRDALRARSHTPAVNHRDPGACRTGKYDHGLPSQSRLHRHSARDRCRHFGRYDPHRRWDFHRAINAEERSHTTAQAGPAQTVVTALASPIISGSNLNEVTLESLGVKGNETIAEPIGIELINSTAVVSNVIVSDLHGANGTLVYTNGLNAIGLRISGTFSVTLFNSTIEDITGGNADVNSEGRGGDGIGVLAAGEGQLTIISSDRA